MKNIQTTILRGFVTYAMLIAVVSGALCLSRSAVASSRHGLVLQL